MRLHDMHPTDLERRYDPAVAELARTFQALRCRHDQLAALVDDLLNVTEKGPSAVALVAEVDEFLRSDVPL